MYTTDMQLYGVSTVALWRKLFSLLRPYIVPSIYLGINVDCSHID